MSEVKKIFAELWSELGPVKGRMTEEEAEWFRNFLRAYYFESREAAAAIAPTEKAYLAVLNGSSSQRRLIKWLLKGGMNDFKLPDAVTVNVKPRRQPSSECHLEDILIEVLDGIKPGPQKKVEVPRKIFASARFSALDLRLIEVHYRLTPW
jgi:hypothetical protein